MRIKINAKKYRRIRKRKNNKGGKRWSFEEIENYFNFNKNISGNRKSGNLFIDISEPKYIMNLLGQWVKRFLDYNGINSNKEDEYNLVKEITLARSTFYDIKKRANDLLEKLKEEKTFNHLFNELLGQYDLQKKAKRDIYEFYTKKFTNNFKMKRIIFLAKKTKLVFNNKLENEFL